MLALSACAVLQPEEAGLGGGEEIEVTTSVAPPYEPKVVANKEITEPNRDWIKDEGLGVSWKLQGVYADTYRGTVVTVLVRNDNPQPLPPTAIGQPKLERTDGVDGFIPVEPVEYDPELNTDLTPPGLDVPLGSQAATNLQYRFDTGVGSLWKAKFTIGNVTWVGNLNV
ncbi:hypothetical protein CPHO_03450 [Corynebacterium phocae]|uniref:DUF4352 domain-containing protein n=2 Tax=Corynebacterium phocae TaxID=161895 RepID=A0A1L7D6E3_9CORY|nr:hypothetical protein CPHO_03450 [Corynebacterium phocae]KAA8726546.1 hypothetical protein F4V58_03000 [Corynebacterium phocae]